MKFFITVVVIAVIVMTAFAAAAAATTTTIAPPPLTTVEPAPTPAPIPQFELACFFDGMGPVFNPDLEEGNQLPIRGPGYGHKALNHDQDILFVVSNQAWNPPPAERVPSTGNGHDRRRAAAAPPTPAAPVNRFILGIVAETCSVAWFFETKAPIVQSPMFDSSVVVFQTFDRDSKTATVYVLNCSTGEKIYDIKHTDILSASDIKTGVHDGRVFVLHTTPDKNGRRRGQQNKQKKDDVSRSDDDGRPQISYFFRAYHAASGELLWGWFECCIDVVPFSRKGAQPKLWLAYNSAGSWGYLSVMDHLVAFEGVTGVRQWEARLDKLLGSPHHCTSGSATMGRPLQSQREDTNKQVMSLSSIVRLNKWTPPKKTLFMTCQDNTTAKVVALHQVNGSLMYTTLATPVAASSLQLRGPASYNKYTNDVCVLRGTSIACFDTDTGAPIFQTQSNDTTMSFQALPTLGYTMQNYVIDIALDNKNNTATLYGLSSTTGKRIFSASAFGTEHVSSKLFGVGFPESFESGWDIALVATGKIGAAGGAFAILHQKD